MTTDRDEFPRRRVLVVAYYFPPMGLSGVQRTLKFVKYMPEFNWEPTVLTVEPRGYYARDESLLGELDGRARIVRTPAAGPARYLGRKKEIVALPPERTRKMLSRVSDALFIPDNKIGWLRKAVGQGLELHQETPFDLIFATAPPFTDFLIGAELKREMQKPLVLDYRDPWVDYPFKFYPTPAHKWRHVALEKRALRASSHVITTNRRVKELLIKRYGFLGYHDIDIIPQGYDPADYGPLTEAPPAGWTAGKERVMRVTYAGVFWEDRVPDYFLTALHELFNKKPRLRGRIEAIFIGNFREENQKLVASLGLQHAVKVLGYLPHLECVRCLRNSDVLWMIVGDDKGSPGKAYEYIGADKPILGCAPEGFIRSTILEAGGKVVAPNDVQGIQVALEEYFDQFEHHALGGPSPAVRERYDRRNLTGDLVRVFESLMAL